ncbi:MAG: 2Fe-2S iron-sulfur cluster binding domain-containing protein [candidate division Zixibacteria bacterium]|nr:2Fe-2S iron-sulfur cluster binding domain-containing protein [candidate division Zixibacteria bacterium]
MPRVTFLPTETETEAEEGASILDAALDADVDIDHNCGGNCACSTCHVIIEEGYDTLNPVTEDEQDMLDEAVGLTEKSRLACQCLLTKNVVVRIPDTASQFADFDDFD